MFNLLKNFHVTSDWILLTALSHNIRITNNSIAINTDYHVALGKTAIPQDYYRISHLIPCRIWTRDVRPWLRLRRNRPVRHLPGPSTSGGRLWRRKNGNGNRGGGWKGNYYVPIINSFFFVYSYVFYNHSNKNVDSFSLIKLESYRIYMYGNIHLELDV